MAVDDFLAAALLIAREEGGISWEERAVARGWVPGGERGAQGDVAEKLAHARCDCLEKHRPDLAAAAAAAAEAAAAALAADGGLAQGRDGRWRLEEVVKEAGRERRGRWGRWAGGGGAGADERRKGEEGARGKVSVPPVTLEVPSPTLERPGGVAAAPSAPVAAAAAPAAAAVLAAVADSPVEGGVALQGAAGRGQKLPPVPRSKL